MERYEDAAWAAKMAVGLDFNYAMADFVAEHGLAYEDLTALAPRMAEIHQDLEAGRQSGRLAFLDLPYDQVLVKQIRTLAKPFLEYLWEFVVLGIGGSALGARALHQALCHPQHNRLPLARKQHKPSLYVLDNIDPDYLFGMLDALDLRRTGVNVISKSGATAETLAQFLFIHQVLKNRLGEDKVRERLIITTDPEKGPLRQLAQKEGYRTLEVPPAVGGRFSVLSAVGLLPAHMAGINIAELLAGARFMDQRLREREFLKNPALLLAAIAYLFATAKRRPMLVIMPYASTLAGMAEWFCQLWAESLGKRFDLAGRLVEAGSTPVRALGVTDQHSQLQLYMEGPHDKLIIFLEVEKFQHVLSMPSLAAELEDFSYLAGRSLNELLTAELQATSFNLMKAKRPNLTIKLPEINAFTLGQLIFLLEVATVAAGRLFGVNPLDQPGVEGGKKTTFGLMGRPGFEAYREEVAQAKPKMLKYMTN
jgi:glucose-6-phosphate isomerase